MKIKYISHVKEMQNDQLDVCEKDLSNFELLCIHFQIKFLYKKDWSLKWEQGVLANCDEEENNGSIIFFYY